jgi:hypothetical protein
MAPGVIVPPLERTKVEKEMRGAVQKLERRSRDATRNSQCGSGIESELRRQRQYGAASCSPEQKC